MIKNLLLAIDGSTTVAGYSVWNKETKELIELGHYKHEDIDSLLIKADNFSLWLNSKLTQFPEIGEMVIEESFSKFSTSNDKVIALLNQINILYQYVCYKAGLKVNTITVQQSRKRAFPNSKFVSRKHGGGMGQKEQAFVLVLAELGEERFDKKTLKSGKNKGTEVFEDYCLDMSDAYIIGKGFLNDSIRVIEGKPKNPRKFKVRF